MAIEENEAKPSAEILAERTGQPVEEFERSEDVSLPDLDELETHDADDFYSSEE